MTVAIYKMLKLAIQMQKFFESYCHPEMQKDHIYNLLMCIDQNSYDITTASCDCPAGKGPSASCKHVGALCYALVEFCTSGKLQEFTRISKI